MCPEVEQTGLSSLCRSERRGLLRTWVGSVRQTFLSDDVSIHCVIVYPSTTLITPAYKRAG